MSEITTRIMEMYKARPDAAKKFKEEYERDIGKKLPEEFDESWLDPSRYKINTTKSWAPSVTLLHTVIDELMHLNINSKWS